MKQLTRLRENLISFSKKGAVILFSIFTFVALLGRHTKDACLNVASEMPIFNPLGKLGAIYSDILMQFFGTASYAIALIPGFWATLSVVKEKVKSIVLFNKYLRYLSFPVFVFCLCAILEKIGLFSGGIVGQICAKYVSGWGWLAVIACTAIAAIFSFNFRSWKLFFLAPFKIALARAWKGKEVPVKKKKLSNELKVAGRDKFSLPPSSLLEYHRNKVKPISEEKLKQDATQLLEVLGNFGVKGKIVSYSPGPVVTLYEFEPAPGIKSSRVVGLADDIARSLGAASARIANIMGKKVLGIEIPNQERSFFGLREIIESDEYSSSECSLPIILGKSLDGSPYVVDLAKMPHLLIAGTTGSGKSVAINSFILSLLFKHSPEDCKMIMIDPKMLELSLYEGIPHLIAPVVTDSKKAISALKWAVKEMERRYKMMSLVGVRNIDSYNQKCELALASGNSVQKKLHTGFDPKTGLPLYQSIETSPLKLPFIVVVVDEMADLMMVAGKEVETSIQRLAQMARASGIHIIMATQRPSVDVITGVIKANFPSRVSFKVTSKIDSRTIIGEVGADQLLGAGDMLYLGGNGQTIRAHGPFVAEKEIEASVSFLKEQGSPVYLAEVTETSEDGALNEEGSDQDADLYKQAVEIVLRDNKVSISYIQRRLHIGYNKAASIIERMEQEGVVSTASPSGKREILS